MACVPIEFQDGSEVLPAGRHSATVDEVENELVNAFPDSQTRRPLFERWLGVREAIRRIVPVDREWIDGSYVTKKVDPEDVDMVTHLHGEAVDTLDAADCALLIGLVSSKISQQLHACDSHWCAVYPPDHPKHAVYEAAFRYWDTWWGHGRDGEPKGYLEVT